MVIKIRPKFTAEQIEKLIRGKLERVKAAYLARLQYIGEEFAKNARVNGDYTDRTGNLRNSIGYVVLDGGRQIADNFLKSSAVNSDDKGVNTGRQKAEEISKRFPSGLVLICVAGMEYAAAVESKGKDVITSSSIIAKNDLIKSVESLQKRFQKI